MFKESLRGPSNRKGEVMHKSSLTARTVLLTLVGVLLLFPALASSYHGGIGGLNLTKAPQVKWTSTTLPNPAVSATTK